MKALLIFCKNKDIDINLKNVYNKYDKVKIEEIDVDEKALNKAHPDTGEYEKQIDTIKVVTKIAEKIAKFYNQCDEENVKGYVSIENLHPIFQMWTYLSLGREKDIKFMKVSQ